MTAQEVHQHGEKAKITGLNYQNGQENLCLFILQLDYAYKVLGEEPATVGGEIMDLYMDWCSAGILRDNFNDFKEFIHKHGSEDLQIELFRLNLLRIGE